jgi:16S rRNA (uracil1498-N3)-methyltransferase
VRFFFLDLAQQRSRPAKNQTVLLGEDESHHLFHVLRGRSDRPLTLTDGEGCFYRAVLLGKQGRCARLRIEEVWPDVDESLPPRIVLGCAVVKGRRFDWALEKAAEMGAHEFWPLLTARSVIQPGPGRQERWRVILQAATKQAGRAAMPRLRPVLDLRSCLREMTSASLYYGDVELNESAAGPGGGGSGVDWAMDLVPTGGVAPDVAAADLCEQLVWLVGPEGGWTDDERRLLAASRAVPVCLSRHRLRTETAAILGLGFLQELRRRRLQAIGAGPCSPPA